MYSFEAVLKSHLEIEGGWEGEMALFLPRLCQGGKGGKGLPFKVRQWLQRLRAEG